MLHPGPPAPAMDAPFISERGSLLPERSGDGFAGAALVLSGGSENGGLASGTRCEACSGCTARDAVVCVCAQADAPVATIRAIAVIVIWRIIFAEPSHVDGNPFARSRVRNRAGGAVVPVDGGRALNRVEP